MKSRRRKCDASVDEADALGTKGRITRAGQINARLPATQTSGGGATLMLRLDRDVPADVQATIRDAVEASLVESVDLS